MSFDGLGLSEEILRAVAAMGYDRPTPIQAKAIPVVLRGEDLLAAAQTGTGKTAGFTLPILERLSNQTGSQERRSVRALVLTPTRELAAQVGESIRNYGRHLGLRSAVIFGGVGINPQVKTLRAGVDILTATPGRLLDHLNQGTLDLSKIEILVLDEADRMLDMGFIHDIRRILKVLPSKRQNLLFSATFSQEIRNLAGGILSNPAYVEVARRNTTADRITQRVHPVDRDRKRELLSHLIRRDHCRQVLVFTRTKHGANRLAQYLARDGITAAAIHGNKSQAARTQSLSDFKQGRIRVLVATDIAARGLDIDQLPRVVNFELPHVAEDYVHRIGRTGRAGHEGDALSLVCVDEHNLLRSIERLLKTSIPKLVEPGFEVDPSIAPEPIPNGRNGAGRARNAGRGPHARAQGSGDAKKMVADSTRNRSSRKEGVGKRDKAAVGGRGQAQDSRSNPSSSGRDAKPRNLSNRGPKRKPRSAYRTVNPSPFSDI